MKHRPIVHGVVAGVLLLALACAPQVAGDGPQVPFTGLQLVLRAAQGSYVVGEPVAVLMEISNPHAQPAAAHASFAWYRRGGAAVDPIGIDYAPIRLSRDRGPEVEYRPLEMMYFMTRPPRASPLPPKGKRIAKVFLVEAGKGGEFLNAPGTVELRLEYRSADASGQRVYAPLLRVSVTAPSESDAEALVWLRERRLLRYFGYCYWSGYLATERDLEDLRAFAEKQPQSVYAPHVWFSLGQLQYARGRWSEAAAALERIKERYPKSSVAEDALFLIAECHAGSREPLKADRVFREILKRFPDTQAANDAHKRIKDLAELREMFYPDDRRLDMKIGFPELPPTPLPDVLRQVAVASEVSLKVAPEFRACILRGKSDEEPLRYYLHGFHSLGARWIPDGDGYRLVPHSKSKGPEEP